MLDQYWINYHWHVGMEIQQEIVITKNNNITESQHKQFN